MMNGRKKGFTLVELMIILVIVAILVALALPSFLDTVRKSRRSDAMNAIMGIHLSQERWRANDTDYATLVELGVTDPMLSPDGHYSIEVTASGDTSYTLLATATGDQLNDACGNFTLTFTNGVISKTVSTSMAADQCWRK
jgi:type IV pilus assembly protein PilE